MRGEEKTRRLAGGLIRRLGALYASEVRTIILLAGAVLAPAALAQSYPVKPIRILLPFAGGTDVAARLLALKLSPAIGQQVIPEQRLGAGGNIAHEAAAKAPADGYTLLMGAPPVVINPHLNPRVNFDPLRDFNAVVLLGTIPNAI